MFYLFTFYYIYAQKFRIFLPLLFSVALLNVCVVPGIIEFPILALKFPANINCCLLGMLSTISCSSS